MVRAILLSLGAALLAFLLWRLGPSDILDALGRVGWSSIPIVALYAAHHAMRALALRACVLTPGRVAYPRVPAGALV